MIIAPFAGFRASIPGAGVSGDAPVVHELTSLQDFSAVGLKDGDYGILTTNATNFMTTTERIIVRYYQDLPVAAGAGGGTLDLWVPPRVYDGTPEIQAYIIGDETIDQDLLDHGWLITLIGNPAFVGIEYGLASGVRLKANHDLGNSTEVRLVAPTVLGSDRFYISSIMSSPTVGGIGFSRAGIFHTPGSTDETTTQYAWGKNRRTGQSATFDRVWQHAWDDANSRYDQIVSQQTIRFSANVFSSFANKWNVQVLTGDDMGDLIETRVNGPIYSTYRRNIDGASSASEFSLCLNNISDPVSVGGSSRMDYKHFYYLKF